MSKAELLVRLHDLAWAGRAEALGGDALAELQAFIVEQIEAEEQAGRVRVARLPNGFMAELEALAETPA